MSTPLPSVAASPRTLDAVPGPRGWPILGLAPLVRPDSLHLQLEAWSRRYGSVYAFRIAGRRFLTITDPETVAGVLRRRPGLFRRTTRLEQESRKLGFLGLFSANGETWRRQRPMVLAGLDPAHIRSYLPAITGITGRLRRRWLAAAAAGEAIDLTADLMRYTVDVTTSLAFGHNLNTLEASAENAIQQHLNVVLPALFRRIVSPLPQWPDQALAGHVAALRQAVQEFIAQARRELAQDPQLRQRPATLIHALVAASEDGADGLTEEDVSGNVLTMLLAGEDTTAHTLAWLFWLLYRHPEATRLARAEVDALLGCGGQVDSIEQLGRLDEVEACANEAMRLKPVAPLIMNEACEDTVVADVLVPRGGIVVCLLRPASLEEAHFSNAAQFDPARWRGGEGAPSLSSAKRVAMPFGAGPRMCPGRYLAMAEIKMVTAMLLANFELAEVASPGRDEPAERLSLTMAPVGLRMKLHARAGAVHGGLRGIASETRTP
jgi:cytochrome P450